MKIAIIATCTCYRIASFLHFKFFEFYDRYQLDLRQRRSSKLSTPHRLRWRCTYLLFFKRRKKKCGVFGFIRFSLLVSCHQFTGKTKLTMDNACLSLIVSTPKRKLTPPFSFFFFFSHLMQSQVLPAAIAGSVFGILAFIAFLALLVYIIYKYCRCCCRSKPNSKSTDASPPTSEFIKSSSPSFDAPGVVSISPETTPTITKPSFSESVKTCAKNTSILQWVLAFFGLATIGLCLWGIPESLNQTDTQINEFWELVDSIDHAQGNTSAILASLSGQMNVLGESLQQISTSSDRITALLTPLGGFGNAVGLGIAELETAAGGVDTAQGAIDTGVTAIDTYVGGVSKEKVSLLLQYYLSPVGCCPHLYTVCYACGLNCNISFFLSCIFSFFLSIKQLQQKYFFKRFLLSFSSRLMVSKTISSRPHKHSKAVAESLLSSSSLGSSSSAHPSVSGHPGR